ncbi:MULTISPECIES: metalloregulator ArsR/SmtB family transcription factor [Thermococcus]|jgi:predicted transcriptional regulator|uniref:Transcriptional regulator, arsR family n=1 Tax=Thermococcus sibiricus (strain DSM 12597 / MM 739) TaxID=604354 RepID=C6A3M9_THESM|nr:MULTISPECIES: metalloregulator ArsR/SmtB family transcription factor [Thermococcus]KUJ99538.1 MAG: Transcriptional regulator, arsR family [Thermococcales archaeon 44_46]KUK29236.1 MAG: Transcriptional regulator, arsR family [Thermococcus sp. 40_45]HIH72023.1 winged helix-turn-helix transcriptional regulator [Thermococcaceae archaeon]ACS90224.1 Transcriptional regulator, arsR family [Thermococcus sibiricus MM 739]MBC7095256.1 winged helix-turn-helix transcriptional regulator [Thermococcus sp
MVQSIEELAKICEALSNPVRIKILKLLCQKEWYVYELAKELEISRQLLYLHLKKLENAGLVESELRLEPDDPRAKKYYRARQFRLVIDNDVIVNLEG